jgi:hypothetical protein
MLHRFLRIVPTRLLVVTFLAGCTSTISESQMRVSNAPPASVRALTIKVESLVPDTEGDQATLLAALRHEFAALGYQVDSGDLIVKATVTRLDRGSTAANVFLGLGIGSDSIDVRVEVTDSSGKRYMDFLDQGSVLDKRYSDMNGVIKGIAKRIAADIQQASR